MKPTCPQKTGESGRNGTLRSRSILYVRDRPDHLTILRRSRRTIQPGDTPAHLHRKIIFQQPKTAKFGQNRQYFSMSRNEG